MLLFLSFELELNFKSCILGNFSLHWTTYIAISSVSSHITTNWQWEVVSNICGSTRQYQWVQTLSQRLDCYTVCLEHYFITNGVGANALNQRHVILLSILCGSTVYQFIRNLVALAKPTYWQDVQGTHEIGEGTPSSHTLLNCHTQKFSFLYSQVWRINDFIAALHKLSAFKDSLRYILAQNSYIFNHQCRYQNKIWEVHHGNKMKV